jgi:glycosyltransferase involved in cell wall biosynthesis
MAWLPPVAFGLSQLSALAYACRLVERESISVIRGADPFVTGLYAYLVARLTGRPFSLRIGANYDALARNGIIMYPRLFPSYGLQRAIGSFVLSRCDLVLAANRNYRSYCIENGAREDRVVVVPYGNLLEPLHFAEPDQRGPLPEDVPCAGRPFAIVVGRLIEVKYPEDVLLVADEVRRHIPDLAVLFVGEGELSAHLEQRVQEMGLQNTVYLMGLQNQEWLSRTYPHASAYLSPLTGRSLAEAALARLPLVAYDTDWHSEIVETGVTGELVPFRDWRAMAAALTRILTDADYALALGDGARQRSLDMMDQTRILEVERSAYERVLEAR